MEMDFVLMWIGFFSLSKEASWKYRNKMSFGSGSGTRLENSRARSPFELIRLEEKIIFLNFLKVCF